MAFQAYVEQLIGQHLSAAAILGHDGVVWAQSSNFPQVKSQEISAVMKNFDEPGYLLPIGLNLGGTKYMIIKGDSGSVIWAKKELGGVTIKKTNQSIVIGIYEAPMQAPQCNVAVENLGDYLIGQGY